MEDPDQAILSGSDLLQGDGYFRMILVRRGAARIEDGGERKIVLPRNVILVPFGRSIRVSAGVGSDLLHAAFRRGALDPQLLGGAADGLFGMIGAGDDASAAAPGIRTVGLDPEAFAQAEGLFERLRAESADRRPGGETMRRLVLAELLLVVYRRFRVGEAARGSGPARFRIEEAEAFIREHYAEDISLSDLAARFGFNPSYFSRLFSERTGTHVFEFLNRVRIEKSCAFLKRSSLSVAEIAFSVGYNNLSHFNRFFRRIMGTGPSEYRKNREK